MGVLQHHQESLKQVFPSRYLSKERTHGVEHFVLLIKVFSRGHLPLNPRNDDGTFVPHLQMHRTFYRQHLFYNGSGFKAFKTVKP
jgi:hypothetical protein